MLASPNPSSLVMAWIPPPPVYHVGIHSGGLASVAIVFIEGSRFFLTGIGNEFVFLSNICGKIFSRNNILLNVLQGFFPDYRAVQLHILMQDGFYLMLFNLVVTILFILVMEGMLSVKSARNREVVLGNPGWWAVCMPEIRVPALSRPEKLPVLGYQGWGSAVLSWFETRSRVGPAGITPQP